MLDITGFPTSAFSRVANSRIKLFLLPLAVWVELSLLGLLQLLYCSMSKAQKQQQLLQQEQEQLELGLELELVRQQ
jgi:hypothetical protein